MSGNEEYVEKLANVLPQLKEETLEVEVEHLSEDFLEALNGTDLKTLIPLIRNVMPGIIAAELCAVQPMTGPVGLIFPMAMKFKEETEYVIGEVPESSKE